MNDTTDFEDRLSRHWARWRLRGFRIAAVVLTGMFLVGLFPALKGIVVNWLPNELFLRLRGDLAPGDVVHRLHSTALAVLGWGMVIGVGAQLHSPRRKIGAMLMALAVPPAMALGESFSANFTVSGAGIPFALLVAVALVHPHARDLLRAGRPEKVMLGLALIGAAPWIMYAIEQGKAGQMAPEWDVAHHAFTASLAVVIVLWSLLGALDHRGWLWPATAAAIGAAIVALKSLIFPKVLSGLAWAWAVAALFWAALYLIAAYLRRRREGGSRVTRPS